MNNVPSGSVTFLFTDVEGSTVLWDQQHDSMNTALAEHDDILLSAIEANNGYVFSTAGDSFGASFPSAPEALAAATQAQLGLAAATSELKLRIRMGLHTGEAAIRDGNYFGIEVNRAARIMGAAHGGQVLISQRTVELLPEATERSDLGEHSLKDLPRPERIFQLNHAGLDSHFPKIKTVSDSSSQLPAPITRFVGRELELIELDRLLGQSRLITLTGTGGAGKTRLALQIAHDTHYQFPDGVRMVELAAVTEEDVLVEEVAQVFDVHAVANTPIVETLITTIGNQRGLLILDNCEQLVQAVKQLVARILLDCPNLTVVCTSRELLDTSGEVVFRVPSLSVPSAQADLATANQFDAITMFVDRARLSKPDFELSAETLADVVSICTWLDGIPLAIELAAARMRLMAPAQIAARLDERFLSVAAESAAGSRHQTLQNAIDWSYDLLEPSEQKLFQRLSGFTGDFTLEAAEQVCATTPLAEHELAEMVFGLVDKSMVVPEPGSGGTTRYRLLESVRNYGLLQLDEAGELDALLTQHLKHYTFYCESLQQLQRAGNLGQALAALDENEDNIRAALRYGLERGDHRFVARMIGAVGYLWYAAGLYREGIDWCSALFEADPQLPDAVHAAVLHAYGTLLGSWAQPTAGVDMLEQEVELRRRLADPARLAAALNNLGNLLHDIGRFDRAEETLREAIDEFRNADQSPTLALASLGSGHLHAGHLEQATNLYNEALEEALRTDDTYGVALATSHLGQCASLQGDLEGGRDLLDEARTRFKDLTVTPGVANADFHLSLIDRAQGNTVAAATRLLASLSAPEAHWYLATQYWIMQVAASLVGDDEVAATLLGASQAHYDHAEHQQPTYVLDDMATSIAQLQARVDADVLDRHIARGRRLPAHQAIASAVSVLTTIIAEPALSASGASADRAEA